MLNQIAKATAATLLAILLCGDFGGAFAQSSTDASRYQSRIDRILAQDIGYRPDDRTYLAGSYRVESTEIIGPATRVRGTYRYSHPLWSTPISRYVDVYFVDGEADCIQYWTQGMLPDVHWAACVTPRTEENRSDCLSVGVEGKYTEDSGFLVRSACGARTRWAICVRPEGAAVPLRFSGATNSAAWATTSFDQSSRVPLPLRAGQRFNYSSSWCWPGGCDLPPADC